MKRKLLISLTVLLVACLTCIVIGCAQNDKSESRYTVTWKNYDGSILEVDSNVEYGSTPSYNGATPTKPSGAQYSYTFNGWDQSLIDVTCDIVYTAQFSQTDREYTITYTGTKGILHNNKTMFTPVMSFALVDIQLAGYIFDGWYNENEKVSAIASGTIGDITLEAKWTPIVYTATFVADGQTVGTASFTIEDSSINNIPNVPNKNGYDGVWEDYVIKVENVTVNAIYTAKQYTITYSNTKGVTNSNKTSYSPETETFTLTNLSKEGYTFDGWYNGSTKVTNIEKGSYGNLNLEAKWTPIIYTATFNADGQIVGTSTFTIEDSEINNIPNVPNKNGYDGVWEDYVIKAENVTVNAIYTAKQYTITWENYDGTILKTTECEFNKTPSYGSESPTKKSDSQYNYMFNGWSPEIVVATEDAIYTATYIKSFSTSYTIYYDANGGVNAPVSQNKTKDSNVKLSSSIPTNGDHVFMGWSCANDGKIYDAGSTFNINANVTLYAVWGHECETCHGYGKVSKTTTCTTCSGSGKVSYDDWSNCLGCKGSGKLYYKTICSSCNGYGGYYLCKCRNGHSWYANSYGKSCPYCHQDMFSGEKINTCSSCSGTGSVEASKTCASCDGKGGHYVTRSKTCTSCNGQGTITSTNTCLTCNGKKNLINKYNSHTVYLKDNGNSVGSSTITINSPYKLAVPTKNGYTFLGWFDASKDGIQYTDDTGVSLSTWKELNNKTLYAHWSLNQYTITYNCDSFVDISNMPVTYTVEDDNISLNVQSRDYYTFAWKLDNKIITQFNTSLAKNVVIKGIWTPVDYSIEYEYSGGTATNKSTYNVETSTFTLNNPTRESYTFVGWTGSNGDIPQTVVTIEKGSNGNLSFIANWVQYAINIAQTSGGKISVDENECSVSFNMNGSDSIAPATQIISNTKGLVYPSIPTRNGYIFGGWYANSSCSGGPFDFTATIESDTTLYAKWVAYTDASLFALNSSQNVYVYSKNASGGTYYAFVPLVNGNINIYSNSRWDTYGYLYDGNKSLLASDDDCGNGYNFCITYNVTAGQLYYFKACGYSSSGNTLVCLNCDMPSSGGKLSNNLTNNYYYTVGDVATISLLYTNEGYDWDGWYKGETLLSRDSTLNYTMTAENVDITAKWTPKTYSIKYLETRDCENSNPSTYNIETDTIVLQKLTYPGATFDGWYNGDTKVTEIPKGSLGDVELTAKWILYELKAIEYDINKTTVSINDTIDGKLFSAICVDTDGNYADLTVTYSGSFVGGSTINVKIVATLPGTSGKQTTIKDVRVLDEPTITYDDSITYFNIKDGLTADWFNASAVDTNFKALDVEAYIEGDYTAGNIVTVVFMATDEAGNVAYKRVENIKVYGEPTLTFDDSIKQISYYDTLTSEYFSAVAKDSFNEDVEVQLSLLNEKSIGPLLTIQFTATDSKGNTTIKTTDVKVYGNPTIFDATNHDFKVSDNINENSLNISAQDSYGSSLSITLSVKSGEQVAGTLMTYTAATTDIVGNTTTRDFVVKIYGVPTITVSRTEIKSSEVINASTFNATATDSFDNNLSVSIELVDGLATGGGIRIYKFSATDNAGNTNEVIVDVKVYDKDDIQLSYQKFATNKIKTTSKGEEFFATAKDGFDQPCELSLEMATGFEFVAGRVVDFYVVATDKLGNTQKSALIQNIKVYGTPTIEKQAEYVCDDFDFDMLFIAYDSFGEELITNIEVVGEVKPLNIVKIKVTAVDSLGNNVDETFNVVISDTEFKYSLVDSKIRLDKYIGSNATVVIPQGINIIGKNAFEACATSIISLPLSLSELEQGAFNNYLGIVSNPQKDYYDANWYNGESIKITDIKSYFGNVTFAWTPTVYSIIYNLDGGINNVNNPSTYTIESETITLQAPTKLGYTFMGWSNDGTIASGSTGNKEFTASWTPTVYSITYNLDGGTNNENNPSTFTIESETITLQAPTKLGYTFMGWSNDGTIASGSTGDKEFTASWDIVTYSINYTLNGGTLTEMPLTYTVEDSITLGTPTKLGYTFIGWSNDGIIASGSTGNKEFVASWTPTVYSIIYNLDGGINNVNNSSTYTIESETITLQEPTKLGYTFIGWSNDGTIASGSTGDKEFTASWDIVTYSISYTLNGGTLTEMPLTYTVEDSITLGTPAKLGYTFIGWSNDGTIAKGSTGNKEFVASWTPTVYSIAYNLDGGTNNVNNPSTYTIESETITLQEPTKEGYNFIQWNNNGTIPSGSIGNKAFVASWLKASIGLLFAQDGDGYVVKGIGTCSEADIVIPDYYKNKPVTGIVNYAFRNCSNLTSIVISDNVTSIGFCAFCGCSGLTNITIPSNVTSIGGATFSGCCDLTSILVDSGNTVYHSDNNCLIETATKTLVASCCNSIIPTDGNVTSIGNYAFEGCSSLTSITIPDSVTNIDNYAFSDCSSLTSVTIPDSVTSIGSSAFYGCSSLIRVNYLGTIDQWAQIEFASSDANPLYYAHNLYVDDKLVTKVNLTMATKISDYAFYGCSRLTSVTIGDSATSIGNYAFGSCNKLAEITLPFVGNTLIGTSNTHFGYIFGASGYSSNSSWVPSSLRKVTIFKATSIDDFAFYGCNNLTDIIVGNGIINIGSLAFSGCSGLKNIFIGEGVTSMEGVFSGCHALTNITVDSNNSVYHSDGNCLIETATKTLIAGCCNSVIPTDGSVTSIDDNAFNNCSNLTNITIPDSITSICFYAFYGCNNLASVTFSDTSTWYRTNSYTNWQTKSGGVQTDVSTSSQNPALLVLMYPDYYWYKL